MRLCHIQNKLLDTSCLALRFSSSLKEEFSLYEVWIVLVYHCHVLFSRQTMFISHEPYPSTAGKFRTDKNYSNALQNADDSNSLVHCCNAKSIVNNICLFVQTN